VDVTLAAILLSWKWRSDVAFVDGALATVYLVGWYRLRCQDPRGSRGSDLHPGAARNPGSRRSNCGSWVRACCLVSRPF
jgi:hypothetical protein